MGNKNCIITIKVNQLNQFSFRFLPHSLQYDGSDDDDDDGDNIDEDNTCDDDKHDADVTYRAGC